MKPAIAVSCAAVLLLAACAGYTPTAAPVIQAADTDLVFNADGFGAKIDPYLDRERQKQYFNADFTEAGFIVVDVVVKNEGRDPVAVRPYDIYLVFPGGDQMAPLEGRVVASQISEGGSIVASTIMFGAVGGLIAAQAEHDAKNSRILDYAAKQLKETTLAQGASTQGYLFYRWTPSASAQAEFIVQLQDQSDHHLSRLTVPFGTTAPFAVPQNIGFVPSAPPANPPAAPQIASTGGPSTSGPVDVPFRIADDYETIEGVAILDGDHLGGQTSSKGKEITISGDRQGDGFAINLRGAILPPTSSTYVSNPYCAASGTTNSRTGKVTIPMNAVCEGGTSHITVYLDFSAAAPQTPSSLAAVANGPVELHFGINDGNETLDGTGTLANGHLTGQAPRKGAEITLSGEKQGEDFVIQLSGPLLPTRSAPYANPYCTGSGTTRFAPGKAAIPVTAICEGGGRRMTVYLELPAAS